MSCNARRAKTGKRTWAQTKKSELDGATITRKEKKVGGLYERPLKSHKREEKSDEGDFWRQSKGEGPGGRQAARSNRHAGGVTRTATGPRDDALGG